MSKPSISQNILEKIKEKHIEPIPHWHFVVKNVFFWAIFVLSIVIGAKAFGLMLYAIFQTDFLLLAETAGPMSPPFIKAAPMFWINAFVIFLVVAMLGLHQTRKGYKISMPVLIGSNLILSIVVGTLCYSLGEAEYFENFMHKKAPFYTSVQERNEQLWTEPGEGRLAGIIIKIQDDQIFVLEDVSQKLWNVNYINSQLRGPVSLEPKEKVRIVGDQMDTESFVAEIISSWKLPKPMGLGMERKFFQEIK